MKMFGGKFWMGEILAGEMREVLTSFIVLHFVLQLLDDHVFALHFAQNRVVVLAEFAQVPGRLKDVIVLEGKFRKIFRKLILV